MTDDTRHDVCSFLLTLALQLERDHTHVMKGHACSGLCCAAENGFCTDAHDGF